MLFLLSPNHETNDFPKLSNLCIAQQAPAIFHIHRETHHWDQPYGQASAKYKEQCIGALDFGQIGL